MFSVTVTIALIWAISISLLPVGAEQSAGQFFNPPEAVQGTHDYSTNPVYSLGKTQTIKFTTIYPNYAINLWQEVLGQEAATRGPSIFSTEDGAVTQFDWPVQLYQFDLSASNVFFLWLTSSSKNDDGSDPISVTSHYFNISDNLDTPNSSSSTLSSTSTASPAQLSTTSLPPPGPSTISPVTTSTSQNPTPIGLSSGAKAGIGVGAGLAGLAIVTLSLLLFRRSRQKRSYRTSGQLPASEPLTHEDIMMVQDQSLQGHKAQMLPTGLGYEPMSGHRGYPIELPVERNT